MYAKKEIGQLNWKLKRCQIAAVLLVISVNINFEFPPDNIA